MKPLFICHGNLMRSQMAEGYFNRMTRSTLAVSAGVSPFTPYKFSQPGKLAIEVMAEEGIDISRYPVKLVTAQMVEEADAVYVMTFKDELPDYVRDSTKTAYWDIADPWDEPIEVVRQTQAVIKDSVSQVIANYPEM